jgi:Tol biopolymer transport system component
MCLWEHFKKTDGKRESWLEVVDIASGKRMRVSQELDGEVLGFCWSPDGKQIAYIWRQGVEFKSPEERMKFNGTVETFLMRVNTDGSNPQVLLTEQAQGPNAPYMLLMFQPDWR